MADQKFKLTYFNVRGKGEMVRLLFKLAGKEFEDNRITGQPWIDLKQTLPLGQLPVFYVEDEQLCQSMAIARYVAKELGFMGSNNLEAAKIDMIVETTEELGTFARKVRFGPEDEKEANLLKTKEFLDKANKLLSQLKKGNFMMGDKPTMADAAINVAADWLVTCGGITPDGVLAEIAERFAQIPQIAEWIKTRPESTL